MTIPDRYIYPPGPGEWPPPGEPHQRPWPSGEQRRIPAPATERQQYPPEPGAWQPSSPQPGAWQPSSPQPGAWQPSSPQPGDRQQYSPPPAPRRRTGRVGVAIGGGLLALLLAGGGGFAAGWTLHPDSAAQGTSGTSPVLPFAPGDGSRSGGGASSGDGAPSDGGFGSGGVPGSGPDGSGPGSTGSGSGTDSGSGTGSGSQTGSGSGGATAAQVAAVAAKVDPALVDITTVLGAQNGAAAGTGIVIGSSGVILTNNHVVAGATGITVTDLGDNRNYRAAVLGYDRGGDIAVLQLAGASGLATATLAPSSSLHAGDPVVAIGNAGGTGGTPSAVGGAITALNQSITASDESSGSSERLTGLIEVDADIQAGDSGGPLLTTSGQVIGVNTAASAGFRYQAAGGDGYAIPIATATAVADRIRAGRSSDAVHLGATAYLGIEATDSTGGTAVLGVVAGSPADAAGLTRGDVITSVGGTTVDSATALTTRLDHYHPGDKVKVTWTDLAGRSHSATVKLATGPVG